MKNKQKAWRLGAIVMGRRARANKQAATIIGGIFREFPQRLPRVHRKRELLEVVQHGKREFCPFTGALLAPWTGYTAQQTQQQFPNLPTYNPHGHHGNSQGWVSQYGWGY
jgi:hypothetical protein